LHALALATPVGTVPAATVETEANWTMLQHWHAQQRSSLSAIQRRHLGVVGTQIGGMRASVFWLPGPPPMLRLTLQNARLADDAGNARPAQAINGVSAITRAIATEDGVRIDNITQPELLAIGFEEPELVDGPATGWLLPLVITTEGAAALPYIIGQMFSIDQSDSRPSMRYCITPQPPRQCEAAYAAASQVEAALAIERLGVGANVRAQADARARADNAQAAPAVGVPVHQAEPAPPVAQPPPVAQAAPQAPAQVPPMAQAAPQAQPQPAADAPRLANVMQPRVFPWTGAGDYSIMDQLCAQLSPADVTNMERWDQLVRALSVGDPPGYPFQPPDEVMARVDYCNTRISDLQAQYDIRLPPTLAPGWLAVFAAVRTLMRPTTSGGSAVIPAPVAHQNSFGSRAQSHAYHQASQPNLPTETAGSSTLAFGTSVQSSASRVEGDRTGTFDAYTRTLLAAHVSDSTNVGTIQNLGERMSSMPRDLHILEAAQGQFFNPSNSASFHATYLALTAASNNFVQNAAGCLRARIGIDDLISPSPERKANTEKFIRLIMHGKILSGTEFMLLGTGGAELFSAFKEVPMTDAAFLRGQSTLQVLSFACKLSDTTTPKNFFEECEEHMRTWKREKRDIGRAAAVFEAMLLDLSIEFKNFFDGHPSASLMRPRYSNAVFATPASKQRIDRFEREPVHAQPAPVQPQLTQQQIAEAVAASVPSAVSACLQAMGHSQAMPLATSASAPSGKKAKKKAKKDPAAPQAAPLVLPAPAVPPGFPPGFPPGLPPAAPQAPAHNLVNLVGIIGGAPHDGAVTQAEMAAFSAANKDANGKPRCFNFWRRGACRNPTCRFAHA
jgi:hypothetical protein